MKKLLGIVVLGLLLSSTANGDEGLDITCLNMKQAKARKRKGAEAAKAVISIISQK